MVASMNSIFIGTVIPKYLKSTLTPHAHTCACAHTHIHSIKNNSAFIDTVPNKLHRYGGSNTNFKSSTLKYALNTSTY
jgi:hypothetical protein